MSYSAYMLQLDQDCKGKFTGEREEPVERAGQETRHPVVQRRVGGNRPRMVVLQVLENMSSNQIKHQNDFSPSCPFDSINGYSWCLGLVFLFCVLASFQDVLSLSRIPYVFWVW